MAFSIFFTILKWDVIARKKYLLNLWKRKEVNSEKNTNFVGVRFKLPQTIIEFQLLQITAAPKSVTIRSAETLLYFYCHLRYR